MPHLEYRYAYLKYLYSGVWRMDECAVVACANVSRRAAGVFFLRVKFCADEAFVQPSQ